MPGHISLFLDTVSPYSYYATSYILALRPVLLSHGITLSLHPIFLGAIQVSTGNIPPFKIPAKAAYSPHDLSKAAKHFGCFYRGSPPFFPMRSLAAQRVLVVLQQDSREREFEQVLMALFEAVWRDWRDLADLAVLRSVLLDVLQRIGAEEPAAVERKVDEVMQKIQQPGVKEKLNANTAMALELGAFGAPFFSVKKWKDGEDGVDIEGEPFFGSDRFEYMFEYLDLPLQKMKILGKNEIVSKSRL